MGEGATGFPSGDHEEACMGVSAMVSTQDAASSPTQLQSTQETGVEALDPRRGVEAWGGDRTSGDPPA